MKQIKAVTYQTPRSEPTGAKPGPTPMIAMPMTPMIDDRLDGVRFGVAHVDRQQVMAASTSPDDHHPDDYHAVGSPIATWPQQCRNGSSILAGGEAMSPAGDHVMADLIEAPSMMIGFFHNFFEKSFHAL